jgi:hypothetical protein
MVPETHPEGRHDWAAEIGEKLFQWRDFTPIPLILLMLFAAEPGARSATVGLLLIVCGELFRVYSVAFIGSVSRTRGTGTTGGSGSTGSRPRACARPPEPPSPSIIPATRRGSRCACRSCSA